MFTSVCEPHSNRVMVQWREMLEVTSYGEIGSLYWTLVPYPNSSVEIVTAALMDLNMRTWQEVEVSS